MTVTETINAINIEHFQKLVDRRSEKIKYVIEPPNKRLSLQNVEETLHWIMDGKSKVLERW